MATSHPSYRADIDGLRAIAVGAVVSYHAGMGVPGGFVGVDVFFVISGFLITSIIWRELAAGTFHLSAFWERRARRILPAMAVMVMATAIAGGFLLFPHDLENLSRSVAAQAVFCANIVFWRTTGYFGEIADEQPLLHTWSLSVEEQFYLAIPLLLAAIFRFTPKREKLPALALLLSVVGVSMALSAVWTYRHPTAAFFILPTRAWELAIGAVLALIPKTRTRLWTREVAAVMGLAAICWACFGYNKDTPFPGLAAAAPCLGTALIIWANTDCPTWVGRGLSLRPLVFIGTLSYSLYLWHWPLLAFQRNASLVQPTLAARTAALALGFCLAYISWKWVETPFRDRRLCRERRPMLRATAATLALVLAVGSAGVVARGFPGRFPPEVARCYEALKDRKFIQEVSVHDVVQGRLVPFGRPAGTTVDIMVWGDSHAMAALPAIDAYAQRSGLSGMAATRSSTAPVLGLYDAGRGHAEERRRFNEAVLAYIHRTRPKNVILVGFWRAHSDHSTDGLAGVTYTPSARLRRDLLRTVTEVTGAGCRAFIMLQVPLQQFVVPKGVARHLAFHEDLSSLYVRPDAYNGISGEDEAFIQQLQAAGARLIDPRPAFLLADGTHYAFAISQRPLYVDQQHLTASGAVQLITPLVAEELQRVGGNQAAAFR